MRKIADVCSVVNGGTPDTKVTDFWDGENLWLTPKDMGRLNSLYVDDTERKISDAGLRNSSAKILPPKSVILSSRAPIGHLAINTKPITTNQGCKGLVPNGTVITEYLYYFLKKSVELLNELGSGTTFKELSGSKLSEVAIPLPPLSEQQQIVSILDEAFAAIDHAKQNLQRNLQNAKDLFQSELNLVFLNSGGEWKRRCLGDKSIIEIIDGDRGVNYPKASDFHDNGHCVFMNTGNVRPNGFDFSHVVFITEEKDKQLRKGKLKRYDVVMTTRGTIGNLGRYGDEVGFEQLRINSGMLIFRPNLQVLTSKYLFEVLRSEVIKSQIRKQTSGAAQPQLPIKTLVNFSFPIPDSIAEQNAVTDRLEQISTETKKLEGLYRQKLNNLEELKKSILERAFRGELTQAPSLQEA